MSILSKILDSIQKFWHKSTKSQALTGILQGTSIYQYITVKDGYMYLHKELFSEELTCQMVTIDLTKYTLAKLRTLLQQSYGFIFTTAPSAQRDLQSALLILEESNKHISSTSEATLRVFTSGNSMVLYPIAVMLKRVEVNTKLALQQLYLSMASGSWLDYFGSWINVKRGYQERDDQYTRRLLLQVYNPQVNNVAMEEHLRLLTGAEATVTDVAPCMINITAAISAIWKKDEVNALIYKIKAFGIGFSLIYSDIYSENFKNYIMAKTGQPLRTADSVTATRGTLDRSYALRANISIINQTSVTIGKVNQQTISL